jgi:septal ring factor EnvC (AmiA/AmiB activator)
MGDDSEYPGLRPRLDQVAHEHARLRQQLAARQAELARLAEALTERKAEQAQLREAIAEIEPGLRHLSSSERAHPLRRAHAVDASQARGHYRGPDRRWRVHCGVAAK